jgi:citrate synthase
MTDKTLPAAAPSADHAPKGLEGVVLGPSSITFLDGLKGRMLYRGYSAIDLAGKATFEEVVHLLWEGELPTRDRLAAFVKPLVGQRALPAEVVQALKALPKKTHPMEALRTGVSLLSHYDADAADQSPAAVRRKAQRLVAQTATLVAAWDRVRKGQDPIAPDPSLSHAANFLYMLTGRKPEALDVEALDMYLTLLADHDLNASTFAACVVSSTLSDLHSAVTAAVGALKGPLHGGANEKAMEMFIEIGDPAKAESFIEKAIADKRKIMGFGHRVYKVEDPRSGPLKVMARRMGEAKKEPKWYEISVKVAEVVHKHKSINTNVDFYSASVLYLLGIPIDLFTPVFAVSRVAGWCAHVAEQLEHNRLIRPRTDYMGPAFRPFVPVDQRR